MTNYERITQSPEALGAFLSSLPCIDGPWDEEFHKRYCSACVEPECDRCPNEDYRGNPGWWLNLAAGQAEGVKMHAIDLDPAEAEKPLTEDEKAELERSRPMFRFYVTDTPELTESEIENMNATEEEKAVQRFLAKNNPEKRVIEVNTDTGIIQLHGSAEVEAFVQLIRDQSREVYSSGQSRRGEGAMTDRKEAK